MNERYYRIGGVTLRVASELPIEPHTFDPKFRRFECDGPGEDTVSITHHFHLPRFRKQHLGTEVYRHPPWRIFKRPKGWTYLCFVPWEPEEKYFQAAVFDNDHTYGDIFHSDPLVYQRGGAHSLTLFPTDQILLARILPDRGGIIVHGSGVILGGRGLLFAGHSGAGKTTVAKLLSNHSTVLCDDRVIISKRQDSHLIHGTWSHGDLPLISESSSPLTAACFLQKADKNTLTRLDPGREMVSRLLACLVRPVTDREWWQKALSITESIVREIPCHALEFADRPGLAGYLEAGLPAGRPAPCESEPDLTSRGP